MFVTVISTISRWLLMYACVCIVTSFIGSVIASILKEYNGESLIYSYLLSAMLLTITIMYIIESI